MLPVSVIIPCYRCSRTIKATVASVINQTILPSEIILIEDCSNDEGRTLNLLERIKHEFDGTIRIIVVPLDENVGAGEARNRGWSAANQEFIAFLDADDTWHPQKLEIQYAWMLAHPECVLTCHDSKICLDNNPSRLVEGNVLVQTLKWPQLLFNNKIASRTVMLKRRITQRFPYKIRHAEDYELWLRILLEGGKAVRLRVALAYSFKEEYGAGGLSSDLTAMHKGVVNCLHTLCKDRLINNILHSFAIAFENIKYWRRILITKIKKILK